MIWGHGINKNKPRRKDGPEKACAMLRSRNFQTILQEVANCVYDAMWGKAYSLLYRTRLKKTKGKIAELGPTYATKFLHFCATPLNCQIKPLIFDSKVASSLRKLFNKAKVTADYRLYMVARGGRVNNPDWSESGYLEYLIFMHHISHELGVRADQLEMFLWEPPPNFP